MRIRRVILWAVPAIAVLLLVVAGALWRATKHVPAGYRPVMLSDKLKQQQADRLQFKIMEVLEVAGRIGSRDPRDPQSPPTRTGTVEVTGDELNRWIAALPPEVIDALAQQGLRNLAASIRDGCITVYAHSDANDAVVSVDLVLGFDAEHRMVIDVRRARLGALPIPRRMWAKQRQYVVEQWRQQVREIDADSTRFGPLPMDDLAAALEHVVNALNGAPIRLDIARRYGHARIRDIRLVEGKAVIELVSLLPK